jgi:hypothetical protein
MENMEESQVEIGKDMKTIQPTFLPHFQYLFTVQLSFPTYFPYPFTI